MKKQKKSVIFSSYECNNNCVFCIDSEKRNIKGQDFDNLKIEIKKAKDRGSEYLEIIGGEFTIRKDAVDIIKYASSLGFETISLTTNGRMFSYLKVLKKFIKAGLTHVVLSIHGHNKELHDSLTQVPGSFNQVLKALNNLRKLNFKNIGSNTTIVKQNYKYLENIGQFLFEQGIRNAEFIFVDPNEGAAKKNFEKLVPRISEIVPFVKKCLDIGKENNIPHWHVRYVPLCNFSDYLDQISELYEVETFQTEHIAPDFENKNVESSRVLVGRVKTKKCKKCKLDSRCEGVWNEYAKYYDLDELKPLL